MKLKLILLTLICSTIGLSQALPITGRMNRLNVDTLQGRAISYLLFNDTTRNKFFVRMDSTATPAAFGAGTAVATLISKGEAGFVWLTPSGTSFTFSGTPATSSITLTAGDGLSGGGDLSANRTFTVNTKATGGLAITSDSLLVDSTKFPATDYDVSLKANSSLTLTAGDGLSGGGDLSTNRTFTANTKVGGGLTTTLDSLAGDSTSWLATDANVALKANSATTITIAGTTNQITSSAGAQDLSANRTWTLSTPQDIATSSSPTFSALTLSGLTLGSMPFASTSGLISQDNSNFFWHAAGKELLLHGNTTGEGIIRVQHNQNKYGLCIQTLSAASTFSAFYTNYAGSEVAWGLDAQAASQGGILVNNKAGGSYYGLRVIGMDSANSQGINVYHTGGVTPTGSAYRFLRPSGSTGWSISMADGQMAHNITSANAYLVQDSGLTALFNINTSATRRVDFINGMDAVGWSDNLSTVKWLLDGAGTTSYVLGKVGINTTTPAGQLTINGSGISDATMPVQIVTSGTTAGYFGVDSGGANYAAMFGYEATGARQGVVMRNVQTSSGLRFVVSNTTEAMGITAAGNVGVGDATPAALFTVGSGDKAQMTSGGVFTSLNGVTVPSTEHWQYAPYCDTVLRGNQTATIGATNLNNTATNGLYRVSIYIYPTTAGTSGTVTGTIAWNDGAASTTTTAAHTFGALGTPVQLTTLCRVTNSTAITWATTVTANIGGVYEVDVLAERIF